MSARTFLAIRGLIAVGVLTVAGIVLIAGNARDTKRSAVVRAQPTLTLATVRP